METLAGAPSAPANADTAAPVETVEADAETATTDGEGSAPSVPEADTPEPRDKVQERIDKLTREKYDALRERDQRDYEIERLRAQIPKPESETPQVAPETFPTLEQFGYDETKYQAAVAQHFTKLAETQAEKAAERKLSEARQQEQAQRVNADLAKREAEFIKSKPDYVEKVQNARTLPISPEMQQILKGHEFGPQLAYHMVENSEAALAIARLPLATQLMEYGRIAERIAAAKAAPKPPVSQAPSPVPKVEGGEAPGHVRVDSADSDNLSDAEWTRRRNLQEQARLRKARS